MFQFFTKTLAGFCLPLIIAAGAGAPVEAAGKPVLTVYTYDAFAASWGAGPKIEKAFEAECACDLKFVATDSSIAIVRKLQLEGSASKADIVLGLDTNVAELARATGLFAEHGAKLDRLNLPIAWNDSTFLPFDYGYFAFIYNSDVVKDPPRSFEALAERPSNFKIVIQDPRSSTPGLGLLLWIKTLHGDKAASIWQRLAPKILTVTKSWSEAYGLFLKGEAEMVLSYTTSPAYHLIAEKKSQYKAVAFDAGHYMQVEVAGMVKSSKNPALARRFMQFMLTEGFQQAIPTGNWMYPASADGLPLPAGFAKLYVPKKALLMDGIEVEKNRKAWVDEWLKALNK